MEKIDNCYNCKKKIGDKSVNVYSKSKLIYSFCSYQCFLEIFKKEKKKKIFLLKKDKGKIVWIHKKYPRKNYEVVFNN